jgi:hypothetical protein
MADLDEMLRQQQENMARTDLRDALDGDSNAALRLMQRVARGEFNNPYVREYLVLSACNALEAKRDTPDKPPNLNKAFLFSGKRKNLRRDMQIAFHVAATYQEFGKGKLDAAIQHVAEFEGMEFGTVKTIYNRNKDELAAMIAATAKREE